MKRAATWVIISRYGKRHPLCSRHHHKALKWCPLLPEETEERAKAGVDDCERCADEVEEVSP